MAINRPYKIRKSLEDTKSQISSFSNKDNAIMKLIELNDREYKVFDETTGKIVYELPVPSPEVDNLFNELHNEDKVIEVEDNIEIDARPTLWSKILSFLGIKS